MSAVGGSHIDCLVRIRQRGFRDNYMGFIQKSYMSRLLDDCYMSSLGLCGCLCGSITKLAEYAGSCCSS
jgi:hypothetical protein